MSQLPKNELPNLAEWLLGFGPPVVFVAAYVLAPVSADQKIFVAAAAYMIATMAATLVAPFAPNILAAHMLHIPWLARFLIIVMGSLALVLQDSVFIKAGPTVYFGLVAATSWISLTGTPRLQRFEKREHLSGVNRVGWRKLTNYAAWGCALMAVLNEVIWRNTSTGFWVAFQLCWVLIEMLILYLGLPVLQRHDSKPATAQARGVPE